MSAAVLLRPIAECDNTVQPDSWELIGRVQNGDADAFGFIYDRYVTTVFRFLNVRLKDRALAEDLTSEVFVRALRSVHSVHDQGRDVGAWLVTIARNLLLDHLKSARTRRELSVDAVRDDSQLHPSAEACALVDFGRLQVRAALDQLGPRQRDCVVFRFLNEMSVQETAAAMGIAEGAVRSLQLRALRSLASILGPVRETERAA